MTKEAKRYLHEIWSTTVAKQEKCKDYSAVGSYPAVISYPQGVACLAVGRIALL